MCISLLCLKPLPIPRRSGFLSQITSLPPANALTLTWQIMLLSQAAHKETTLVLVTQQTVNERKKENQ